MNPVLPAIVAIGYNRPQALNRLLESIGQGDYQGFDKVPLIISLDKSDNQSQVAAVAEAFRWPYGPKQVRLFDERQGLRSHVLSCGDLSETYGAVILLEDDLVVSPGFYQYAYNALAYYQDAPELAGIALYSHAWNGYANVEFLAQKNQFDTYLGQFSITWGQCWSRNQWLGFRQWYAKNSGNPSPAIAAMVPDDINRWPETSWGKYFVYYIVENSLYYVIPYTALSTNCEEAGQHAQGSNDAHQVMLLEGGGMDWRFAPISQAVRYDIFFERMDLPLPASLANTADSLCVDLNDTKRSAFGKRYLLSPARYDLPVAASFGMRLRPIEANVTHNIPGDGLFLYDLNGKACPSPLSANTKTRMDYETYGLGWRKLLKYSLTDMCLRIRNKIRRILHGGRV